MYIVKNYSKFSKEGLKEFGENYKVEKDAKNYDAIIVHSTPLHDEKFSKDLKIIVRVGAGVNTIPVDKLTKEGVAVFNTPGGNANAVKELTIATLICICRNVKLADKWVCSLSNGNEEPGKEVEKGKEKFVGPEIMGKTVGILGLGNVGGRVAKALFYLGVKVIGYDPYLSNHLKEDIKTYVKLVDDVNELYEKSDIVSVHIPFSKENEKFVNKAAIDKMKKGVYLVNLARGQVVDNDYIVKMLNEGKIKAYATDFPTKAMLTMDNVLCTPHLGAGTPEAEVGCDCMAAMEIKEFLENGNVQNSVNFPCITMQREEGSRITILHQNKIGMLEKITELITKDKLNIENLANKGRGEIAYTILDFANKIPKTILKQIDQIEGVIKSRIID